MSRFRLELPSFIRARTEPEVAPEQPSAAGPLFTNEGHCPFCGPKATFTAWSSHYRDTYVCQTCGTIPRERALMIALDTFFPNWRALSVHESSPADRGVSKALATQCPNYVATQFDPAVPRGTCHPVAQWRCEDLEAQTFASESFDLVVTQDVLEHLFDPDAAFREIARTLKPGGAHIATVPLVRGAAATIVCATRGPDGTITHLQEPDYHHNPVHADGALVTFWWGYDIANRLDSAAAFNTMIWLLNDRERGVLGPLNEVLISFRR